MNKRSGKFGKCAGFSLLELVVAFSILSVSLAVLYQIFSLSAQRASVGRKYSDAILLAESKLAEIAVKKPIRTGELAGEFDSDFRWRSIIEPYAIPGTEGNSGFPVPPYRITVEVSWGTEDRPNNFTLNTIRLVPK